MSYIQFLAAKPNDQNRNPRPEYRSRTLRHTFFSGITVRNQRLPIHRESQYRVRSKSIRLKIIFDRRQRRSSYNIIPNSPQQGLKATFVFLSPFSPFFWLLKLLSVIHNCQIALIENSPRCSTQNWVHQAATSRGTSENGMTFIGASNGFLELTFDPSTHSRESCTDFTPRSNISALYSLTEALIDSMS